MLRNQNLRRTRGPRFVGRMSALGHKRTFCERGAMSALPPKADIDRAASSMSARCQWRTFEILTQAKKKKSNQVQIKSVSPDTQTGRRPVVQGWR